MEFSNDLKRIFVEQFASNHNNHQNLFTKILSLLLTVIVGYGYVYIGDYSHYEDVVSFSFILSSLIIFFGLLLICNLALGFRRDQFVVFKIRDESELMSKNGEIRIFPESFNPIASRDQKNHSWNNYLQNYRGKNIFRKSINSPICCWKYFEHIVSWMPNFHNIHFLVLVILMFLLLASFLFNPNDNVILFAWCKPIEWSYVIGFIFWLLMLGYIINRLAAFRKRLDNLYDGKGYYDS